MCFRIAVSTTSKRRMLLWALSIAFECLQEGGIEIFGFAVLAIFYLNFSIFLRSAFWFSCQKTSVFRFWCSFNHCVLRIFRFFSIMFSVFVQNTSGFLVLVSDVVFGFSYFALFGLRFNFDLSGNSSRIAAKNQCY